MCHRCRAHRKAGRHPRHVGSKPSFAPETDVDALAMVLPMAERTKKQRTAPQRDTTPVSEGDATPKTESTDRLKAELDDLLDDIDEVLETNAEDFVKSYVQKGGQ